MRNLLRFFINHHFVILFLLLEGIAIYMVLTYNNFHNASLFNSVQEVNGYVAMKSDQIDRYFSLNSVNAELVAENARLRENLDLLAMKQVDSLRLQAPVEAKYTYRVARVLSNSVNKQYNYITIDKGIDDGVLVDMAVVSPSGVIGKVLSVSDRFAVVLPVLNRQSIVSVKFKKNNFFGPLSWDGSSYRYAILNDIPNHITPVKGDTIVTSGLSIVFPEGLMVGIVEDYELKDGNFLKVRIKLSNDFRALNYVYVIKNAFKKEQIELENSVKADD